jgi:hypothetical protein
VRERLGPLAVDGPAGRLVLAGNLESPRVMVKWTVSAHGWEACRGRGRMALVRADEFGVPRGP